MDFWLKNVTVETNFTEVKGWTNGTQTILMAIEIKNNCFAQFVPMTEFETAMITTPIIDAKNDLLLPGLVEKHCHLDKSKLGEPWYPVTPAKSLVERFETEIPQLDALPLSITQRAQNLITAEIKHGATNFRSHIDIEPMTELRYLMAIKTHVANAPYQTELVAFPQHGLLRSHASQLMEVALANGATFVGGVDPYSLDGDYQASLAETFRLATKYNAGIDIHVHDQGIAGTTTIKEIIRLTALNNMQNRVYISHAFGLNDFVGQERVTVFGQLAALNIHVVTSVPLEAGIIPPIKELLAANVAVHVGCDNVYDSWSPYGDGSLQQKLVRLGEMMGIKGQRELTQFLGLVTDGQVTLNLTGQQVWPKVGDDATFILTSATCTPEFITRQTKVNTSYNRGNLVFKS